MKNKCQVNAKKIFNLIENDKLFNAILIGGMFVFLFRIVNLDCDLPPFGISYYQSIDEGLYSKMAINLYKYGSLTNTGDFVLTMAPNYQVNIIANIVQYFFMLLLGNNYYGFRMSYVLIAFITFYLQIHICKEIIKKYNWDIAKGRLIILGLMIFIITDFSYLLMSRTVENSCFRAFSLSIAIYIFLKISPRYKYFYLSLIGILSIFLIYYSNIIILFCAGILFINAMLKKECKRLKTMSVQYFFGISIGVVVAECYYLCIWKQEAFYTLFQAITSFSERVSIVHSQSLLEKLTDGFFLFFSSNMFFYSLTFLVLSIIAFFVVSKYAIKEDDELLILLNACIIGGLLQSMLTSDWMQRKAISFYPALIVNIFFMCCYFCNYKEFYVIYVERKNIKYKLSILALWFFLLVNVYKMLEIHNTSEYFKDFAYLDVIIVAVGFFVQFILISFLVFIYVFTSVKIKKRYSMLLIAMTIFVNLFFSCKYVFNNDNYSSKNTMKDIGVIVGNDYIAGPYAYGFSLYNDCKMISSEISLTIDMVESGINYVLDYSNGPTYANQIIPEKERTLVYERLHSVQVYGKYNTIGLYKKYP